MDSDANETRKELLLRLEKLEGRLLRLEKAMYRESADSTTPHTLDSKSTASLDAKSGPGPQLPPSKRSSDPNSDFPGAGQVLGGVAMLFFVLAAAYLVKLAADSGWLTPVRQWGGAMALGTILIALGCFFRKRDEAYFSFLPGTGIVVCYLAAYAGNLVLGIYGPPETLGLLILISIASLGLFYFFRQFFYVVTAMLGTYLVPWLLPSLNDSGISLPPYFLCWDLVFCTLSIFVRQRTLILLAAYLGLAVFGLSHPSMHFDAPAETIEDALIFQTLQFFIFAAATLMYSIQHNRPLSAGEAWAALPLMLFFYGLQYHLVNRLLPDWAPEIALGFAAMIFGLYFIAKAWRGSSKLDSGPMISGYLAIVIFHASYIEWLPSALAPYLGLLLLLALPLIARVLDLGRHRLLAAVLGILIFFEYGRALFEMAPLMRDEAMSLNFCFAVILLMFSIWRGLFPKTQNAWPGAPLLIFAHVQAMCGLGRLMQIGNPGDSGRLMVSAAWGFYGMALVGLGRLLRDGVLARSALIIFVAAAAKALIYDIEIMGGLTRVIAFLGLGVTLYVAGLIFKSIQKWELAS